MDGVSPLDLYGHYSHENIVQSALDSLTRRLKVNLVDLPQPISTPIPEDATRKAEDNVVLTQVDYAATCWVQHVSSATRSGLADALFAKKGPIDAFLSARFLEWLECLSLLQRLATAVKVLQQVRILVDAAEVGL